MNPDNITDEQSQKDTEPAPQGETPTPPEGEPGWLHDVLKKTWEEEHALETAKERIVILERENQRLRVVLSNAFPSIEIIDRWAKWIDDVSHDMEGEPGDKARFDSEVAFVKRSSEEARAALATGGAADAVTEG